VKSRLVRSTAPGGIAPPETAANSMGTGSDAPLIRSDPDDVSPATTSAPPSAVASATTWSGTGA
jgi:hypothetical protein